MRHRYIIYAPPYTRFSAGIKALHVLAEKLKEAGEAVDVWSMGVLQPKAPDDAVVIYPEIVEGNPLQAKRVVRWLLYYAGRYRGNYRFPETDMVWGYTIRIARDYGVDDVLYLPVTDENECVPPPVGTVRKGSCFYAHKYRVFYGGTPGEVSPGEVSGAVTPGKVSGAVEITNPGQSREEIIRLLQTSEVFFTYEDTALIFEAVLCGCPVVCLPNAAYKEACGLEDFNAGIAWGMEEFGKALATVDEAHYWYGLLKDRFKGQLAEFIDKTQKLVP